MKLEAYLSPIVLGLCLISGVSLRAEDIKSPATIQLGEAQGRPVVCRVRIVHTSEGGGTDEVHLQFQTHDQAGRQKTFEVTAGECSSNPRSLSVTTDDYIHLGRKQVFVSATYGRTTSYLYDCDGDAVHTLYKHEDGREEVRFIPRRNGQWRLAEYWRYDQYHDDNATDADEDKLGTAFVVYPPKGHLAGKVVRMLRWDGKQFVPDLPGPSKIVAQPRSKA